MFRHGKSALILALAAGLAAASASAQTSPPASGETAPAKKPAHHHRMRKAQTAKTAKPSMTEACETDMAIFCGDLERKGARVAKCLRDNKAGVSSGCAAAL